MSAPHCCQAKQKKNIPGWPAIGPRFVKRKKRTGVVDSPGTIPSNRPNLFSESSLFRSRCHRAAFGLTVAFIRLHSHGLSRLSGSPASLDSGIPEIDVDQRLHDQSIVAEPGPSPPAGRGQHSLLEMPSAQPGDLDKPLAIFLWGGGDLLRFCRLSVTTSADARTCPLQGGLPNPALDGTLQGCFASGLWLSALSSSTMRVRWRCCC